MNTTGRILSSLGLAALFGGMVFFGAILAPLVFIKLQEPVAGDFIRATFPWYYGYMLLTAAISLIGFLLLRRRIEQYVMLAVFLVTALLWTVWLPYLEVLRLAGKTDQFNTGHNISVWINGAQLLALIFLLVRTAIQK
jgi:hypothetical protein